MALLAGLTGGMGSGKSLAAEILQELGAHIIDADKICRSLVEPEKPAWSDVVGLFGDKILNEDGSLDRKKIAGIIFNDPDKKREMENILHPMVFSEELRVFHNIRQCENDALVIVDSPLLIESGNYRNMDKVVVVSCDQEIQVRRIVDKGIFSAEEARKRINNQMELKKKLKFADYVLENNSTVEALKIKVEILYRDLKKLAS